MPKRAVKKKAAKKAPAKKKASKALTTAQRNAKAYAMLKDIVERVPSGVINDYLCEEGREIVLEAANLTGVSRFLGGHVNASVDVRDVKFKDLRESDSAVIDYELVITNKRTGEVVRVPSREMDNIDEEISVEFDD